ncbi:MAG: hypothetical protein NWE99_01960 [Candidatus Bathyarchaeota archaeon]|nr:hypothetical protein [Candidatus Bathyarchaeota archaeon]
MFSEKGATEDFLKVKKIMYNSRIFSKFVFAFGAGYALIWALSILILVPYYSSAGFSYSPYNAMPLLASYVQVVKDL